MKNEHHAKLLRVEDIKIGDPLQFYGELDDVEVENLIFSIIGINEVRRITEVSNLRPQQATFKLLLIRTAAVTFEAQQALLKILEEPPETTKFFFVVPWDFNMLPTLASRFDVITNLASESENSTYNSFCQLPLADRLVEISKRMTKKDTVWTMEIRRGLVASLKTGNSAMPLIKLKVLSLITQKLGSRGASNKMLLEELALTMPNSAQK